jgi:hypothetical protein
VKEAQRWVALGTDEWDVIEARVRGNVRVKDDFVQIPFPRIVDASGSQIAAAAEAYQREAAVVDARLSHEVTVHQKAVALADLCARLGADTGIDLTTGSSVADEKVTLFCKEQPLRDVMRQLSRPFGYSWTRSRREAEYRYELTQDLRSQLLEEELRNRDRHAALIALEKEIDRYRPYLGLSPEQVRARAQQAPPAERPLLEKLAGFGWGPIQIYFRLSRSELAALRAGETLKLSAEPSNDERPLPPEVSRGVLQALSLGGWRVRKYENVNFGDRKDVYSGSEAEGPEGRPLASVPEARGTVTLKLEQSELGQFSLNGDSGYVVSAEPGRQPPDNEGHTGKNPLAVGQSGAATPKNGAVNAALAREPSLRTRVTLRPEPSWKGRAAGSGNTGDREPKVTSADVLEAVHQATGLPIVADYYTRLAPLASVSVRDVPLFDALNRISDGLRLRWDREARGGWLQLRSATCYHDRLKEVPNRLLTRWAASRRQHGALQLDDLIEIAALPDAQLDAEEMAEGARLLFGLVEWDLGRNEHLRPHLRYLARFTPGQREETVSPTGLPFEKMPLPQQQQFITNAIVVGGPLQSLDELAGAALRVDYTQPGWYEWRVPGPAGYWLQWVMPLEPGDALTATGKRALRPPVRERTPEATLAAARRIFPQVRAAMVRATLRFKPDFDQALMRPQISQIAPTGLNLSILYLPGATHRRTLVEVNSEGVSSNATW